jgi:hypothetical protein
MEQTNGSVRNRLPVDASSPLVLGTAARKTMRLALAAAIIASATVSSAEPITIRYAVTIDRRHDLAQRVTTPFALSFDLTMTFDSVSTGFEQQSDWYIAYFGPPTFSGLPDAFAGLGATAGERYGYTTERRYEYETPHAGGHMYDSVTTTERPEWPRGRVAITDTALDTPVYPHPDAGPQFFQEANARSLVALLGRGPLSFWHRSVALVESPGGYAADPGSYEYEGTAQVIGIDEPAPVPEPATWLLLSTGVAAVWRSRRRRQAPDESPSR